MSFLSPSSFITTWFETFFSFFVFLATTFFVTIGGGSAANSLTRMKNNGTKTLHMWYNKNLLDRCSYCFRILATSDNKRRVSERYSKFMQIVEHWVCQLIQNYTICYVWIVNRLFLHQTGLDRSIIWDGGGRRCYCSILLSIVAKWSELSSFGW